MIKRTIFYNGKVVFEKVRMSSQFKRFPKVFQEQEACFLYMSKGSFKFRTPTNLIEILEGKAVLAKCVNYFIEQSDSEIESDTISVFGAYFYLEMVKDFLQSDLKLVDFKKNFDVNSTKVEPLTEIQYLLTNIKIAINENRCKRNSRKVSSNS